MCSESEVMICNLGGETEAKIFVGMIYKIWQHETVIFLMGSHDVL